MTASLLLGVVVQLAAVWINYRIGLELGVRVTISDWCWVFGIVSIASALPFSIGGIGIREGSLVGSLALLGVAAEKAMAVSIIVFSLLLAAAAIGGLLDWRLGKNQRKAAA